MQWAPSRPTARGLDQVVGHRGVDDRHTSDVDDHKVGLVLLHAIQ
jgi:hypothetical protein